MNNVHAGQKWEVAADIVYEANGLHEVVPPNRRSASTTASELERPTAPDSTDGVTLTAAAATARYYFTDVFNYLKTTGDVVPMKNWSDVSCSICRSNMSEYAARNAARGLLVGKYQITDAVVREVKFTDQRTASVTLSFTVGPFLSRPSATGPATRWPRSTRTARATLTVIGNGWMMYDWEAVE